ncbi:MAG: hypothetical protein AAGH53_00170 [Pseudomonadota bacterium]
MLLNGFVRLAIAMISLLAVTIARAETTELIQHDFDTGRTETISLETEPMSSSPSMIPDGPSEAMKLPLSKPILTVGTTEISQLFRVRSVLDTQMFPATALAKLYRLNADGSRSGNACTAQFVGPRHLLTALHCIIDVRTGKPHSGFELAIGFDNGLAGPHGTIKAIRSWYQANSPADLQSRAIAERCSDFALVEVAEPVGLSTGWLGMKAEISPESMQQAMYRFSYPNRRGSEVLRQTLEQLDGQNLPEATKEAVKTKLRERISDTASREPEFSPDNLYFEFGNVDRVEPQAFVTEDNFTLPGQSGSVWLDRTYAALSVHSRNASSESIDCRLNELVIGAFSAVIEQSN